VKFRRPSTVAFIEKIARREVATGISSEAMAGVALGWREDVGHNMPYDRGDWNRCLVTYDTAPRHLRRKMNPIMSLYYTRLVQRDSKRGAAEWRMRGVSWPRAGV